MLSDANSSMKNKKKVISPQIKIPIQDLNIKPNVVGKGGVLFFQEKVCQQPDIIIQEDSTTCDFPKRYRLRDDGQLAKINDDQDLCVDDVQLQKPANNDDFHFIKPNVKPIKDDVDNGEVYNPNELYVIARPLPNREHRCNKENICNVTDKQIQDLPKVLIETETIKPKKGKCKIM